MVDGLKDRRWMQENGYNIGSPSEPNGSGELIDIWNAQGVPQ